MKPVRVTTGLATALAIVLVAFAMASVAENVGRAAGADGAAGSAPGQTLYYIPHTHWEGAVFKTREGYLEMGLPHILAALRLLRQYPDYRFTLDQVAYIRPFLERYPEEAADFRRFVAEGRLGIVGGMDVMPDDVKPGGELFVRQVQYGKRYCREALGVDVTTGWFLDTFGHHPQMPQILALAGYRSFWFCRGVPHSRLPSEFRWEGIDGTAINAFWLPGFYGLFYGPPQDLPGFTRFFRERYASLDAHAAGTERAGLAGVDVSEPEAYVPPLIEQFNRQPGAPFRIRCAVPADFEAAAARRPPAPVVRGDFNPIFPGTYSSRIELKQRTRAVEQLLLTAEKLGALAGWLGAAPDADGIWRAWEPVLFNQTHDLASGVMTDVVYEDTVRGYDFSERLAREMIDARWDAVAARIDTRGPGDCVVVFNPLGWPRTDLAEVEVGCSTSGVQDLEVTDAAGRAVAVQWLETERHADGGLRRVRLAFLARDVPALGYSTYRVLARRGSDRADRSAAEERGRAALENGRYRLTVDAATGAVTGLYDKSEAWEVLSGPANVIARETDHGDLWELYRGLDGGSYIAMTNVQSTPRAGQARFSSEFTGTNGAVRSGPVFSEFAVSHAFGDGRFATRVRIYEGLRRIEFRTELVNGIKYVRYQALFPTSIRGGRNVQEIPFGAVERPAGIEFPAQNWIDYGDGRRGVALLNRGLPGNVAGADGTLMLSLLRSHNLGQYGFGGGYEPGMSSESGFELGQPRSFDYALVPHRGDWSEALVFRDGLEFNRPLIARKVASHAGSLPPRWGWLEISSPTAVLSALTPARDGSVVLRLYEAAGRPAAVTVKWQARVAGAREANLMEHDGRALKVTKDTIQLDLHPFEIRTVKVRLTRK